MHVNTVEGTSLRNRPQKVTDSVSVLCSTTDISDEDAKGMAFIVHKSHSLFEDVYVNQDVRLS